MKKILFVLLMMVASTVTMVADDFEVDGIYYNLLNSREVTVTNHTDYFFIDEGIVEPVITHYSGDVVIPETVNYGGNTYEVVAIDDEAFLYSNELTSVTLPSTIISIGWRAFLGCTALTSIDIPNSVVSINDYAFADCKSLTSVSLSTSLTSLGEFAFADCTSLSGIEFPNTLVSIGVDAFNGCRVLEGIDIPASLTSIGLRAFAQCYNLRNLTVDVDNPVYDSRDNCNAIIETSSNTLFAGCRSTLIPNTVTAIGGWAFYGCIGLESITIPNSVTSLGMGAFLECRGLTTVHLPNTITSIPTEAFSYCTSIRQIDIPASVTSIGVRAFNSCFQLDDVYCYMPDLSLVTLYNYIFDRNPMNVDRRTLHVPQGTLEDYQAETQFSRCFGTMVEMEHSGDANGDGVVTIKDVTHVIDYLLGGDDGSVNPYHADVDGDGNVSIKDVTALIDQLLSGN